MDAILDDLNVSRETLHRLKVFEELLHKWNPKINLISKKSAHETWNRHILDSAQAFGLCASWSAWGDIGSGGGFPGLVVAILAEDFDTRQHVTLIESDIRKATFLRTVVRELGLSATVEASRIEAVDPMNADVLSARALASLDHLLGFAERHMKPDGTALFFKGETWEKEVEEAQRSWSFSFVAHRSRTDPKAAVLEIKGIKRV